MKKRYAIIRAPAASGKTTFIQSRGESVPGYKDARKWDDLTLYDIDNIKVKFTKDEEKSTLEKMDAPDKSILFCCGVKKTSIFTVAVLIPLEEHKKRIKSKGYDMELVLRRRKQFEKSVKDKKIKTFNDFEKAYKFVRYYLEKVEQPGMLALRNAIIEKYGNGTIRSLGIYSNRTKRGKTEKSAHSEGRAWDLACSSTDKEESLIGKEIIKKLVDNWEELGIKKIVWNSQEWDNGRMKEYEFYGKSGKSDKAHKYHIHVELDWKTARDNPIKKEQVINLFNK